MSSSIFHRPGRGFSLPEALVALALLAVLALFLLPIYLRADRNSSLFRERCAAWDFVESQVELYRASGGAPEGEQQKDLSGYGIAERLPGPVSLWTLAEEVAGLPGLQHVTITLSWRGGEKTATVETYIGPRGIRR